MLVKRLEFLLHLWNLNSGLHILDIELHTILVLADLLAQHSACFQVVMFLTNPETFFHWMEIRLDCFLNHAQYFIRLNLTSKIKVQIKNFKPK